MLTLKVTSELMVVLGEASGLACYFYSYLNISVDFFLNLLSFETMTSLFSSSDGVKFTPTCNSSCYFCFCIALCLCSASLCNDNVNQCFICIGVVLVF